MKKILLLTGLLVAYVVAGDFTLNDLKNLKNQVARTKERADKDTGDGPCGVDCYMLLSDVEKKLGVSDQGTCVSQCWNGEEYVLDDGREDCVTYTGGICVYNKKIGRKMYSIIVKYASWEAQSGAESVEWEETNEKTEDVSAGDPDPDRDGICSPWVSQNGVMDEYGALCEGTDECPEASEDYDGYRDGDGCPDPDNDRDGVCDPWVSQNGVMDEYGDLCYGIDKCPDRAGSGNANGCPDEVLQPPPKFFVLEGVSFESGKATITRDSYSSLMKIVDIMETFKEVTFKIVGHTDNLGSKEKSRRLSADRAAAVKNFLVKNGISGSRIETSGKGGSQPVASNKTSEGRAQNRRIEFIRTDVE